MDFLIDAWNYYNQVLDKIWKIDGAAVLIKLLVLLYILMFSINLIKNVCTAIVNSVKNIYRDLCDAHQNSILNSHNVSIDTCKEIERAPLIETRSFLWDTKILKITKDAFTTFLPFQLLLIKAGLILVLPPKCIFDYFKGIIVATDTVSSPCGDITITVSSFIVIPNKLTYAEILYENTSDKEVSFKVAKDKIPNIIELSLQSKYDGEQQVAFKEIDNKDFLCHGTLLPKQQVTAKVVFKTINRSTSHSTQTYKICGSLKFQGNRDYKQYELTLNSLTSSEDACIQRIKSLFDEHDLFTVFKCGGIAYVASLLILVLFVTTIFCADFYVRALCFVVALAILILSIPANIAVIQYIYDNHRSKTL